MKQNGKVLARIKRNEDMGVPSVDCMIYRKGECIFRYQSGYSDAERTRPINGCERYNIYSCSKPITCCAALQLVERGVIGLDTPVYEYLPEFRDMKKKAELCAGRIENHSPNHMYRYPCNILCFTGCLRDRNDRGGVCYVPAGKETGRSGSRQCIRRSQLPEFRKDRIYHEMRRTQKGIRSHS